MAQEQLIRSLYDSVNNRNLDQFVSFFTEDGQFKDISTGHVYRGRKEIRQMAEGWLKGLPDLKLQLSDVIGNGDVYAAEFSIVGTHNGPLEGPQGPIPATGKKVNVPTVDMLHVKNGKIQSLSCYYAATVLMSQIGQMQKKAAA